MVDQAGTVVLRITRALDEAVAMQAKALAIFAELSHKECMATVYANLGNVHVTRGGLGEARRVWKLGLELNEQLGLPNAELVRRGLAALDTETPD